MWFRLLIVLIGLAITHYGYGDTLAPAPQQNTPPPITTTNKPHQHFGAWLYQQGYDINPQALDTIESIITYADTHQIEHNHILTFIDYSIPANQKRLWIFDLEAHNVLFHTYVSHGLKSGTLESQFFSNRFDSKASSIGVYRTNKTYYGRHGLSLKLDGLDKGFNDNADTRTIVMHGGWYVEEDFVKKYGRAGRSWGCPAIPDQLTTSIINTIKEKSLFIIYYPNIEWFAKSRFLEFDVNDFLVITANYYHTNPSAVAAEKREDILLASLRKNKNSQETEAILTMPADKYALFFQTKVPLERMLRRQIENQEYIALSKTEFDHLLELYPQNKNGFQDVYFILPEIKMSRGYYATEMRIMNFGAITAVQSSNPLIPSDSSYYTVQFTDHTALSLKTSHKFIRWLGL